jgi:hypothetical protein
MRFSLEKEKDRYINVANISSKPIATSNTFG